VSRLPALGVSFFLPFFFLGISGSVCKEKWAAAKRDQGESGRPVEIGRSL